MKKRTLSILLLVFLTAALALSLVGCGGKETVRGFSVNTTVSTQYYDEISEKTTLDFTVFVTNESSTQSIRSYKYKVVFRDYYGSILDSRVYSSFEGLDPYDTESFYYHFGDDEGNAIRGEVALVDVYPVEMTVNNETENDSSSGDTEWDFWTWFWVIISGILIFLFISCCIGADGDSDAIIGGVVIFLAPAILILVVYFGFFFG